MQTTHAFRKMLSEHVTQKMGTAGPLAKPAAGEGRPQEPSLSSWETHSSENDREAIAGSPSRQDSKPEALSVWELLECKTEEA
ncbi:Signal-Induced Proliferation-Associated 1-Like Protein 3 [Manis pentadactyla]|nr:Signal-Induced Proliferation-Associated 1-Like Protein 3 [Manis pentadactyla]